MKLKEVKLHKVKKYNNQVVFDFTAGKNINTLSGMNGAGKSTIFEALIKLQKAYFVNKIIEENIAYEGRDLYKEVGEELFQFMLDDKAYIQAVFQFDKKDQKMVNDLEIPLIEGNNIEHLEVAASSEIQDEVIEVTITLKAMKVENELVDWRIEIEDSEDTVLKSFWNLSNPKNIIAFISSIKNIIEKDITFDDIKLRQDKNISPIVNFVLNPTSIFENLYEIVINDYLYEKIIPVNRKGPSPRKDLFYHVTKMLFATIMPDLSFTHLSGSKRENQFIFSAKNKSLGSKQYDMRQFSSGEKLIWYTLLFINYIKNMGILIIDEPENHLHEEVVCKLSKLLHDITISNDFKTFVSELNIDQKSLKTIESELEKGYRNFRLNQVFLLTHSKGLIYHNFSQGTNFVLGHTLMPIDYASCEQELRKLGISYVNDKILFVEGDTDIEILENVLDRYNIKVRALESCSEIIKTFEGIKRVSKFLQDPMFVFLIDRDTRSVQEIESIRSRHGKYFDNHFIVMDKHELENYFLEPRVIAEVLKQHQSDSYQPPTEDEIKSEIYEVATEQLKYTRKKYLNYHLQHKIEKVKRLIKHNEIEVEDKELYNQYINDLFNKQGFLNIKKELTNLFDQMQDFYEGENWEDNWHDYMDGKSVFGKVTAKLSEGPEIRHTRLKREIKSAILRTKGSELNNLIDRITFLFGITQEEIQVEETEGTEE
ncbi:AAA family ATPase [Bacillus halotolerans]|uniref:AAA family ATPase n=1 Tax=Bacillus halotolerans TaxID=260554 RepID=UPI0018DC9FD0|nr:AAA family ATPase [Bacillus halotolerans]QPZ43180.1 AAA family ATPase [Bacillus halotolerans]